MFQGIDIKLLGPICKCRKQNLGWGTRKEEDGPYSLVIFCFTCKTGLTVSGDQFTGTFVLQEGYPEGVVEGVTLTPNQERKRQKKMRQREDVEFLKSIGISSTSTPQ